ncbi:hypothetical protein G8S49_11395 [Clostridium botulinum C]|uniref:Uncharacterized protein n=2 Tax=Clostridium botulinum TaxID=1491 RepID=A0A9Q4TGH9_CLOBO|nr:hypothetical protein [Clostridium botulinum]EGO86286.2 hypothetical protein CBCST_22860 [Clostridium botulinum C str. Stockholm]MCD3195758.1 hypothetical protein [Clostridium botulinum C]MCD3201174.1 hypothetical protein [Clostridium botulinum C]MCD3206656.1 hypothetical protein [Clostridium botulinum C]MCD3209345.1 hypothetical protein [Clostridium botulinum C]
MDRKKFDEMSVKAQINYVNSKLETGYTLTKLCKKIQIGRSTVRKRFKGKGYEFNKDLNKYIGYSKVDDIILTAKNAKVLDNTHVNKGYSNNLYITKQLEENRVAERECAYDVEDTTLDKLYKNTDDILKMLEWWKNKSIKNSIDISRLNNYINKTKTRSFNINIDILDKFVRYCNKHKEYQQTDLISIALLDFLDKYK